MKESEIKEVVSNIHLFKIVSSIEARTAEVSPQKHNAWLKAGKPLTKAKRCGKGHWKSDYWKDGARLYSKTVNGKRLSVGEWQQRLLS